MGSENVAAVRLHNSASICTPRQRRTCTFSSGPNGWLAPGVAGSLACCVTKEKSVVRSTLISTVGPVEPPLLEAFIEHYRILGVERFELALHMPEPTDPQRLADLLAVCRATIGEPSLVVEEPWHENASDRLREELRRRAGDGWHLLADADEFQDYPQGLAATLGEAEAAGWRVVGGILLDRIAADGAMPGWSAETGLDRSYPLGGFLTGRLMMGNPRKLVLVHSKVRDLVTGNHQSPSQRPMNRPLVAVHHFKWRSGVEDYLRHRIHMAASGQWRELSPAPREEAGIFLRHIADHNGRSDIDDPHMKFAPTQIGALPSSWAVESERLMAEAAEGSSALASAGDPAEADRAEVRAPA